MLPLLQGLTLTQESAHRPEALAPLPARTNNLAPTKAVQPSQHGKDTSTVDAPSLTPLAPHNEDLQYAPEPGRHSMQYDAEANSNTLSASSGSGNASADDVHQEREAEPEANATNTEAHHNAPAVVSHPNAITTSSPATFLEACKLGIHEEEVGTNEQAQTDSKAFLRHHGLPAGRTALVMQENGKARAGDCTSEAVSRTAGRSQARAPDKWQVVSYTRGKKSAKHVNEGQKKVDRAAQPAGRNSRNPSVNTQQTMHQTDRDRRSANTRAQSRQGRPANKNRAATGLL